MPIDYSKYENANLIWPGVTHDEMEYAWPIEQLGPDAEHPQRAQGWYWYLTDWCEVGPYATETAARLDRYRSLLFAPLSDWYQSLATPEILGWDKFIDRTPEDHFGLSEN